MPPSLIVPLCPQPPDWAVDWPALQKRFAWLATLGDVPQDATYHAEGDVLTHTRMVAESLAAMEAWRTLPEDERAALFVAALLHDIAKPACTQIEADGRISSPRHARVGAQAARHLLWRAEGFDSPLSLDWRERVTRLVRHHGLPLWFFEKGDPARAVIAASQSVRLDHVALLAEADVRGRICADQPALLARIELFRAYSEEQDCLTGPRAFASDHSRFLYFRNRNPQAHPDYAAYDDTVCEVTLLSGLPGAGKDTWLRENVPNLPVIALDDIRHELGVAPSDTQGEVVRTAKARARELLRRKESFAWNATNITRSLRGQLIDLFAAYRARVHIVYLDTPYATLFQRNAGRRERVPDAVILKLAHKLEVPDLTEAQRVDWIAT